MMLLSELSPSILGFLHDFIVIEYSASATKFVIALYIGLSPHNKMGEKIMTINELNKGYRPLYWALIALKKAN